jgi:DNA-binding MarR family transcriptional regulator
MSDRQLARTVSENGARKGGQRRGRAMTPDLGVLNSHLGYFIRRAQVWVFQDFIRTLAAVDIRPAQYSVLIVIASNPGFSQAEVGETLGIERARLVRLLDRLERRNLIQRLPSPSDRRSHVLRLTREGQTILKRATSLAARHEVRLIERLGKEQHRSVMHALRSMMR